MWRNRDTELTEQRYEVAGPTDTDGRRAGGVFEHPVPADDPGDELTHGRVRIGVRAARDRNRGRHLRVAQSRERAGDANERHRDRDGGARVERRGLAREYEDARAHDA